MSLLDTASLIVTPNGYEEGKLFSVIPSDGSGDMSVVRNTDATRVNVNGFVETMGVNIPRLDYSNGTCPSILVEQQSTNLNLFSEQFDNVAYSSGGGAGSGATFTTNYGIAPDGNQTADRVQITRGSNYWERYQRKTTTIGKVYTLSFWGKAVTGTPTLYTAWNTAYQNPVTFTNEWVRYTYTYTAAGTSTGFNLITWVNLAETSATADVMVWGIQLEQNSYATSYIPTTSASVTRNTDIISKTGISSLIGQTEGTIFIDVDFDNLASQTNNPVLFSLFGNATIYMQIFTSGYAEVLYNTGAGNQAYLYWGGVTNGRHKIAFGYKANDFILYVDGTQVATDTNGSVDTLSSFYLGYNTVSFIPTANYNAAALWTTRLSNTQLAQLTTI